MVVTSVTTGSLQYGVCANKGHYLVVTLFLIGQSLLIATMLDNLLPMKRGNVASSYCQEFLLAVKSRLHNVPR